MKQESKRLYFKVLDLKQRMFFESYIKDSEKNFLQPKDKDVLAVETTIDINDKDKSIYLNRMDAALQGNGYGRETLEFILKYFKQKGFKTAKGYVEFTATGSRSMMNKLKFKEVTAKDGSYFERKL
jgi:predicted GNAT family acetyltransferase